MSVTRLTDIIEPSKFTDYIVQNTMQSTVLVQAGIMTRNSVIAAQITAGAHSFTVPAWLDLGDDEANIINDDPLITSTPNKLQTTKQVVRKAFLHNSWASMNLASELAGSDAISRIQERAQAYWERQLQKRLVASLTGVMAGNVADDSGDMVLDISTETGAASKFSAAAVIDAAGTMGDAMSEVTGIAMHGDVYRAALKADLIEFVKASEGSLMMPTFRGLAVVQDDGMPVDSGKYTTALFGAGAFGFALAAPRVAQGTEIENLPSAGNGGGQQVLHSRVNIGLHPAGFSWNEASVVGESATQTELEDATNWSRVVERKAAPLAFLVSKI
ncbi:hypothetical protein AS19_09420 [Alcanivorax sp. NBRC 101098]|jgi:hypothetical protein|uniref:major capsid protein n=1 Tax=Alcanivorax sp. NBRC 101098 TaxID=1113728 RepID=UPI0004ABE15E|nr:major capsid protein [Alcanivorax sp. NBRC 101098]BAP13793.1 hypothetical protein AS19_09420 [Alcanivorax sp. NBRC 101098]